MVMSEGERCGAGKLAVVVGVFSRLVSVFKESLELLLFMREREVSMLSATSFVCAQRTLRWVSDGEATSMVVLVERSFRGDLTGVPAFLMLLCDIRLGIEIGVPHGDCEEGISLLFGVMGGGIEAEGAGSKGSGYCLRVEGNFETGTADGAATATFFALLVTR